MAQSGEFDALLPNLSHHATELSNGITMHYVRASPPAHIGRPLATVVLVHGWPDCWYGWRRQLPVLASAGFLAIAPDCRGYGGSSTPTSDSAYSHEHLCQDMLCLLDHLEVRSAVFIGHDWGGQLVWNLAQHAPKRVCAVGAICTPFTPTPETNPWPKMQKEAPGTRFDYQLYFQTQEAIDELNADPQRALSISLRSAACASEGADLELFAEPPTTRKGLFTPWDPSELAMRDSSVLTEEAELKYYVEQYKRSGGFHGGMRWYRNVEANWRFMQGVLQRQGLKKNIVMQPALMVTAGKDKILTPEMVDKYTVPFVPNLTRGHVEGAGHWVLQETGTEEGVPHHVRVTRILLNWLQSPIVQAAVAAEAAAEAATTVGPSVLEEGEPRSRL